MPEYYDPGRIADDLGVCRQRGLDWLDRKTSNQVPVTPLPCSGLPRITPKPRRLPQRAGHQIKLLLREGIEEFSQQGHPADAGLLRDLFFGDSMYGPIKPPGELLKKARENRVTQRKPAFVSGGRMSCGPSPSSWSRSRLPRLRDLMTPRTTDLTVPRKIAPRRAQAAATTGYVGDTEHFIQLLAEAVNVTIVGITNERLAPMLQEALRRKQGKRPSQIVFWGSLRIVFLGKSQLALSTTNGSEFQIP